MAKFISFTSGSCGNCSLLTIETPDGDTRGLLIDAGISLRRMKACLQSIGLSFENIAAVIVTHDHMDHIRHLGAYCKRLNIPVYATSRLHSAFMRFGQIAPFITSCRMDLRPEQWNQVAEGFLVRYFVVPHDATETLGYAIDAAGHKFVLMTDLGQMTPEAMSFACQAETVVIESDFDLDMLMAGPYPYDLKMRICTGYGHLSNDNCAMAIRSFYHEGLRNIFLCHISEQNNTPSKAIAASLAVLKEIGAESTTRLVCLPRMQATPYYTL